MRASSSAVRGPVVSQPDRSVSATASTSSSVIAGGWNDKKVSRLDESSGIRGDEAYALRDGLCPCDGVVTGVAGDEDGSGTIRPAPERREDVAGLAVDPRVDVARHLDALEDAGRRDEELRHRAADPRLVLTQDELLPERRVEREPVQVDTEHGLDELRVVAPAEPRRDLDHLRPIRPDAELCIGGAVRDAQRGHGRSGHVRRLSLDMAR